MKAPFIWYLIETMFNKKECTNNSIQPRKELSFGLKNEDRPKYCEIELVFPNPQLHQILKPIRL